MASLKSLPVEVLVDNLFPQCDLRDLLSLARTNKFFAVLCADDTFWRRKCEQDFNFSGAGTARTSGWKFLYKGLHRPRIFVWGENRNGRLGLASRVDRRAIPQPTEIKIPKTRIVSLVAGGMSFHALDSVGSMYVWGTLDGQGQMALHSEGFSIPYKAATTPHKLLMPEPIRSISCGRLHTMALDSASQVWTFLSWGRPFRLQSPLLDSYAPDTTPQQIECGWAFSSILTKSGDVLVYWPFNGDMQREIEEREAQMNEMGDKNAYATSDKCISCAPWILQKDPFRLPVIPALPDLPDTGLSEEQLAEETKLIKIAAYDCHIVGLTNKGHVLKFGDLSSEVSYTRGRWEYLPQFSEAARVAEHPTFSDPDSTIEAPKAMHITHISAHFETFVAYSTGRSSVILMGSTATNADTPPKVLPALQHRDIISVVLGDYHFGALTATGKLFTWGSYSQGALGLGDPFSLPPGTPGGFATEQQLANARRRTPAAGLTPPPEVEQPTEVNFNVGAHTGGKFCFAAAAAGWHTGALVIDLEPDRIDELEDAGVQMPGGFPAERQGPLSPGPHDMPVPSLAGGFGFGSRIFRFGHAARGMNIPGRGYAGGRGTGGPPGGDS